MSRARYGRAPSAGFERTLEAFLPVLRGRHYAGLPVEPHLREHDQIALYVGLARPVWFRWEGGLLAQADPFYMAQDPGFFTHWRSPEALSLRLGAYLERVRVPGRYTEREGAVQARMGERMPGLLDREAVLGYPSTEARDPGAPDALVARVRQLGWAQVGSLGGEADFLAIDPNGTLVVGECKDAGASAVYYAPLQLTHYLWQWSRALPAVRAELDALASARARLGLGPVLPKLSGALRGVICTGVDTRSAEVRRRSEVVLDLCRSALPAGVGLAWPRFV